METVKDFFKNIIQSGSERMNSPIIGTYFISFVIFNWRPILILIFSNSTIEKRIEFINNNYSNLDTILIPIYITTLYIIILPHLQLLFDFLLGFSQKLSHDISQTRKRRLLKGKIEEASLEREIADSRAGTSEISNLKLQVDLLKEQNDDLLKKSNAELQNYNNQIAELHNQQSSSMTAIENLRKESKGFKDAYDKLSNNMSYIELPKETIETLNNFSDDEQYELIKLSNKNFKEAENQELINKSLKFGILYRTKNDEIALSQFGKVAFKYFSETLLPF
jgi:hypothetical protein